MAGPKRSSQFGVSMTSKRTVLLRAGMLALFAKPGAFGQPAGVPRIISPVVTILPAVTGALLRNQGAGNASVDLGRVSYFHGTSAPGQSSQKQPGAFVITTRFALKVDCPGTSAASK